MLLALDRFFFNHYCNWFRSGAFGESISKIPMLNICDDHVGVGMSGGGKQRADLGVSQDLIDGFGSYPDDLQGSPVFSSCIYLLFNH